MLIDVLTSHADHPVHAHLESWVSHRRLAGDAARLLTDPGACAGGDYLFLISYSRLVPEELAALYGAALVIHASDLPRGRGMSPLVWQVLEGRREIVVTLLEAGRDLDAGPIWAQLPIDVAPTDLWDEINEKLFAAELELMTRAVERRDVAPRLQDPSIAATYYPRRRPEDSRLDPERSIAAQFDLLRICDPVRYPAFLDFRGCRYRVSIAKDEPA